jgi:hypothetical protein
MCSYPTLLVLKNFQNQSSSFFEKKIELENHQLQVFHKHQRTDSFHESTSKEPSERRVFEFSKKIENKCSIAKRGDWAFS